MIWRMRALGTYVRKNQSLLWLPATAVLLILGTMMFLSRHTAHYASGGV